MQDAVLYSVCFTIVYISQNIINIYSNNNNNIQNIREISD